MGLLKKIILCILFMGIVYYFSEKVMYDIRDTNSEKLIEKFKNVSYNGIILNKYIDKEQHNIPIIVLNKRKESIPLSLYKDLKVRDSVVKKSGTLDVIVYSKDKEKHKVVRYPNE